MTTPFAQQQLRIAAERQILKLRDGEITPSEVRGSPAPDAERDLSMWMSWYRAAIFWRDLRRAGHNV